MARIKHIAIRTIDPQKTALFYKEVFGLKEVGLGLNGIYLSDGHLNVAILKAEPSGKLGIDHFGFHVEDVEKTLERLGQLGGKALTEHRNANPNDPSQPQ